MSPRKPDPAVADRLVEVAARLLAVEGPGAISARRVATEAGASTMVVYTHFGSMDELLRVVRVEGFRRFGVELERAGLSSDPVADVMAQGWGYRHFAMTEPHLYDVMFRLPMAGKTQLSEPDLEASMDTFASLVGRIERCAEAGPWLVDDAYAAAEVVWSTVHGHCALELSGYHEAMGRDPVAAYGRCLLNLAVGFGQEPAAARRSASRARARARKRGQLD